jgi:hypothetical protein
LYQPFFLSLPFFYYFIKNLFSESRNKKKNKMGWSLKEFFIGEEGKNKLEQKAVDNSSIDIDMGCGNVSCAGKTNFTAVLGDYATIKGLKFKNTCTAKMSCQLDNILKKTSKIEFESDQKNSGLTASGKNELLQRIINNHRTKFIADCGSASADNEINVYLQAGRNSTLTEIDLTNEGNAALTCAIKNAMDYYDENKGKASQSNEGFNLGLGEWSTTIIIIVVILIIVVAIYKYVGGRGGSRGGGGGSDSSVGGITIIQGKKD